MNIFMPGAVYRYQCYKSFIVYPRMRWVNLYKAARYVSTLAN